VRVVACGVVCDIGALDGFTGWEGLGEEEFGEEADEDPEEEASIVHRASTRLGFRAIGLCGPKRAVVEAIVKLLRSHKYRLSSFGARISSRRLESLLSAARFRLRSCAPRFNALVRVLVTARSMDGSLVSLGL
jgi:hypothetical protein